MLLLSDFHFQLSIFFATAFSISPLLLYATALRYDTIADIISRF